MARASNYTLLTLDRYAKVMGINPLHFNQGTTPSLDDEVLKGGGCDDVWMQHDWQDNDKVSREHLARIIHNSETEIADLIGYWPAPRWIEAEEHQYPDPFPPDAYGRGVDVRSAVKPVKTFYGKYIMGGRRTLVTVGEASQGAELVYSDEDSDGFYETATITLTIPDAVPDDPDTCKFKVYFDGEDTPDWEIRYPESATIDGTDIVLVFDSWLFIDPDEWEKYPTSTPLTAIDVSTINNFVTAVDVYYEYNDFTQASVEFTWESGSSLTCDLCGGLGCTACDYITQDGCAKASNRELGIIRPTPASYDGGWDIESFDESVEPDMVKIWYYSGDKSQEYIKGRTCDPLSAFWADVIATLSTARLKRNLCSCPSIKNTVEHWQVDLGKLETATSYFQRDDIQNSPFGTLRGEVYAWGKIKNFVPKRTKVAVI